MDDSSPRVQELFQEFMNCLTTGTLPVVEDSKGSAVYATLLQHAGDTISLYVELRMKDEPDIGAEAFTPTVVE